MDARITPLTLALAGSLGACGDGATSPSPGNAYLLSIFTAEGDATRNLLALGDTGLAALSRQRSCPSGTSICAPEDVYADFLTSDSSVVALQPIATTDSQGQTRDGHLVHLIGRAPGSVQVSSSGRSVRVDVVATPLPLDSVRARVDPFLCFATQVSDGSGNVRSVNVTVGQQCDFLTLAYRGGDSTAYLPGVVTSSDTTVAEVLVDSAATGYPAGDPWVARQCWGCEVGARSHFTVLARLPGPDSVVVTARGRRHAFLVNVH